MCNLHEEFLKFIYLSITIVYIQDLRDDYRTIVDGANDRNSPNTVDVIINFWSK